MQFTNCKYRMCFRLGLLSFIIILNLSLGHSFVAVNDKGTKLSGPITKPENDKREYRGLTLKNEMKVLLISDSTATKAAASLTIAAGAMNDPKDLPGLAHFTEHAVFLGNVKYPEENGFSKFLSANSGTRNAVTFQDSTNFHFNVAPKSIKEALDRFANLFISPRFSESSLEREVQAVNSENEKNIPNDGRRVERVDASTANPDHPYTQFRTGSRDTLWTVPKSKGMDVMKAVMDFHDKYYSANLMTLAVIAPDNLDYLQTLVEDIFLNIPNKERERPFWPENPYGPNELQTSVEIVPISDLRSMSVTFPIPYTIEQYKTFPTLYLTYLIGHEGEGSLLSLLKKKNWATSLVAGPGVDCRGFATFKVAMGLTQEGFNNTNELICHVHEYIHMLQEKGPQEWYWNEIKDIVAIGYRFREKSYATNLVTDLTSRMQRYPIEDVLTVGALLTEYKPDLIKNVMDSLVPENSRIVSVSQSFEETANLTEKYYGVKYSLNKIDSAQIQKWQECTKNDDFFYPPKNEFIPAKFDEKQRLEPIVKVPLIINDTDYSKVWFLQDNEYKLPKGVVSAELYSPIAYLDPLSTALNYIFAHLITDSLSEFSYNAHLAGLAYSIVNTAYGLDIRVNGFDDKLGKLLNKIMESIANFEVNPQRFETAKDSYVRFWKSKANEEPSDVANAQLTYILREKRWTFEELLAVSKDATVETMTQFAKDFIIRLRFQWLFYGNFLTGEALQMAGECQSHFEKRGSQPLLPTEVVRLRDVAIPEGTDWLYTKEHKTHSSSSVTVLYQTGMQNNRESVILGLLNTFSYSMSYDQLRTKEQLGYTVGTLVRKFRGSQGFQILVQGDRHPAFVESRIDNFLEGLDKYFSNLTAEAFEKHKVAYAVRRSQKPKTVLEKAQSLWSEILLESYNFERQEVELAEIPKITLEEFLNYFREKIGPNAPKRRRLSIHILSVTEGGAGQKTSNEIQTFVNDLNSRMNEIPDVPYWKKQMYLYPAFQQLEVVPPSSNSTSNSTIIGSSEKNVIITPMIEDAQQFD